MPNPLVSSDFEVFANLSTSPLRLFGIALLGWATLIHQNSSFLSFLDSIETAR